MDKEKRLPRITVELDNDISEGLKKYVRWGLLKPLINAIFKDFIRLCDEYDSELVIGAIISNRISLKEFISKHKDINDDDDDNDKTQVKS